MTPVGHNDLFPLIEKILREATAPMDCHQIYALGEVRSVAPSANRVSDYLGVLFRKGQVLRVPAESGQSKVRWSYVWREKATEKWKKEVGLKVAPKAFSPKPLVDRPNIIINETGNHIIVDMPGLRLTLEVKQPEKA